MHEKKFRFYRKTSFTQKKIFRSIRQKLRRKFQKFNFGQRRLFKDKSGRAADSCGPDLQNLTVREIQNVKNFVISFSKIQDYELSKMVKMQKVVDS